MKVAPDQVQVLVVDPSGDRHSQLHVALKAKGFVQVTVYDDLEEAKVASLHFAGPTLILFFLPRERGNFVNYVRFFQRGATKPIEVAIVALTNVGESLKREFLQLGAAGFLTTDSSPQAMALVDEIMADEAKFGPAFDPIASSSNLFRLNPLKSPTDSDAPWIPSPGSSGGETRRSPATPPRGTDAPASSGPSGLPGRRAGGAADETGGKMFVAPARGGDEPGSQRAPRRPIPTDSARTPVWTPDAPSSPAGPNATPPPPQQPAFVPPPPAPRYQAAAAADSSTGGSMASSRAPSQPTYEQTPLYAPPSPVRKGPGGLVLGVGVAALVLIAFVVGAVLMKGSGDGTDIAEAGTPAPPAGRTTPAPAAGGTTSEPFRPGSGATVATPAGRSEPITSSRPLATPTPPARSVPLGGTPAPSGGSGDPFVSSSTPFNPSRTPVPTPVVTTGTPRPRPGADFDPWGGAAAATPAATPAGASPGGAAPPPGLTTRAAEVQPLLELRRRFRAGTLNATTPVTIEGVVTFGNGGFVPGRNQFNIQDDTGGLVIDDLNRVAGMIPRTGERVRVTGRVDEYRGMLQMTPTAPLVALGPTTLPAPQVVTVAQFDEALEGVLVRVNAVQVSVGSFPPTPSNMNIQLRTSTGETLRVFIDQDTGIMGTTPLTPIDVQGVLYTFDGNWVVYPRGAQDILARR